MIRLDNKGMLMWVVVAIVGLAVGYIAASSAAGGQLSAKDAQITGLQAQVAGNTAMASQKDAMLVQKDKAAADANAMAKKEVTNAMLKTDTKAAGLRVLLNSLEREHVHLAAAATRNGFDGDPAFGASAGELANNTQALSDAVGSVYGAAAGAGFKQIWESHIGFFVDYTVGAKTGDKAKMDKAVQNLGGYADAIADFMSGANPNLPREAVKGLVLEHIRLLKGAVDAHGARNYTESFAKEHAADVQIGTIADAISGAIVKQKPEAFQ